MGFVPSVPDLSIVQTECAQSHSAKVGCGGLEDFVGVVGIDAANHRCRRLAAKNIDERTGGVDLCSDASSNSAPS